MEYFDYGEEDLGSGFDVEDFLEKSQNRQRQRLEDQLERIEEQLDERERIFKSQRSGLESKLDQRLEELETAYRLSGDVEELKNEIKELYNQLHQEELKHWRDRQELEDERRALLEELNELSDINLKDLLQ